ncbi:MAG: hypothetical protein CL726_00390 [Chloroflexi bacterium]|nr:hypothetical protein [Chloroflexota bacterium]|tara:strand:- start:1021 stop:1527 length:507 start_codon:yes stop_codon:yes gene_type:complete
MPSSENRLTRTLFLRSLGRRFSFIHFPYKFLCISRVRKSMPFNVNHIHLKSSDPKATADWFVEAFNVEIKTDNVRPVGDRFITTMTEGGLAINISSERTDEKLGPADADPHYGLEHFGFDTDDMDADIARLQVLGAELKEGPINNGGGVTIAFVAAPGDIRIELIHRQ